MFFFVCFLTVVLCALSQSNITINTPIQEKQPLCEGLGLFALGSKPFHLFSFVEASLRKSSIYVSSVDATTCFTCDTFRLSLKHISLVGR